MGFWWGDLREDDHLKGPGIDRRIILKWILNRWWDGGAWAGLIWLRMTVGSCECGNEPLEIIKGWKFLA